MNKKTVRNIKKATSLIPKWAYYVGSLFIGGPVGPVVVYLLFHALDRAEDMSEDYESYYGYDTEANSYGDYNTKWQSASSDQNTVYGDDYVVKDQNAHTKYSYGTGKTAAKEEEVLPTFDSDNVDEIISQGQEALRLIRRANDRIPDPVLSAQIDSIEDSCRQILQMLEQRPELLPQLRTFLRYYLPTTLRLLNARAKLDTTAKTPKAWEVRSRITTALGEIDHAFKKQVEALDEFNFVDLESEMDVLTDMLKADGLYEENKEASQVSGQH